jgi:hypothetical protein
MVGRGRACSTGPIDARQSWYGVKPAFWRRWQACLTVVVLCIPLQLSLSVSVMGAERAFYFLDPSRGGAASTSSPPLRFGSLNPVDLNLELRTLSVEEQNAFPPLVIDDYRYDTRNHFADHRVPNLRFEVMTVASNEAVAPAAYRVGSQGGSASGPYLRVNAWFELGRSRAMYWALDHLRFFLPLAGNWRGTYRIRAFYRPGRPRMPQEMVTPPIVITVI